MKKFLFVVFVLITACVEAFCQTTAVTAQVIDNDAQTWNNCTWNLSFLPNFQQPNLNIYNQNGTPLSSSITSQTGSCDGSGNLSLTVYQNGTVTPSGSSWKLSVCPNSSFNCSQLFFNTQTSSSINLTSAITTAIGVTGTPRFKAVTGAYGYNDSEAQVQTQPGSQYYNVTLSCLRIYNAGSFTCLTNGSFFPFTGGTITGPTTFNSTVTQNGNSNFSGSGIWNSLGQVGIGTTSPGAALEVNGNMIFTSNGQAIQWLHGSGTTYIVGNAASFLKFGTGNTDRLTILNNGDVGIGTTGPGALLEVNGTAKIDGAANIASVNGAVNITGDGSSDNSAAIQSAVNACSIDCEITLQNAVIAVQVTLPININVTFSGQGNGLLSCTASTCLYRHTTTGSILTRISFLGIHFVKSNAGIIVRDDLAFSSSGNVGMSFHHCSWQLSSSAVGFETSGADYNIISANDFNSSDSTGVAIQPFGNVSGVTSSMVSTVTGNTFRTIMATNPILNAGSTDAWEGWLFTGNHFWSSTVLIYAANGVNFVNNEFVTSNAIIDSSFNELFADNYLDTNVNSSTLLTVQHTNNNNAFIIISGNNFQFGANTSCIGVLFTPGNASFSTSNVNMHGNIYVGSNNTGTTGGYGVYFSDSGLRNLYSVGENFRLLYSPFHLATTLDKSTIDRFEARDVFQYGDGFSTFSGTYLRSDPIYQIVHVHLSAWVPSGVTSNAEIAATYVGFTQMFNPPTVTVTPTTSGGSTPCTTNDFLGVPNSGNSVSDGNVTISLFAGGATPPAGFHECDALVTLNGQAYIAPR